MTNLGYRKPVKIIHLYARELNVYGDDGNVRILEKRLSWQGFVPEVSNVGIGESLPEDTNLIVAGGGQDSNQDKVQQDLFDKKLQLFELAQAGVPMLLVCGSYQLFGQYFLTADKKRLEGIGLLDVYTIAGDARLIGNVVAESEEFGQLYGFENHSGKTFIKDPATTSLSTIVSGRGNNGEDQTEGARKHNVIGTYMHGPALSKNPILADWLIDKALLSAGFDQLAIKKQRHKHPLANDLTETEVVARVQGSKLKI